MKTILVTGGAGFIGSHLCESLIKSGHNVIAIDNFDPFYPRAQKEQNLVWLKMQENFKLLEADVRDAEKLDELFTQNKFDHVFHLAGRGGIPQSKIDPLFYLDDIARGTLVLLECMAKHKVPMIVNASTSSVYAQTNGEASKETDDVDHPGSVYTASKRAAELLCHSYHVLYNIGAINVRFFSVYGPRGRQDMIIYKFTKKILSGEPIINFQPDPKRDFTYVSDIVDGLVATLEVPQNTYAVINLGCGNPFSVSDSIKYLENELGKKAVMGETLTPPASDMAVTHADISFTKQFLNWEPRVTLEEGVKKFVEWYKETPQFTS